MLLATCLVLAAVLAWSGYRLHIAYRNYKSSRAFSALHGCEQAPRMRNRWPLGIDRLLQTALAASEGRILDTFTFHFKDIGATFEMELLGIKAFSTADPKNLEAILSSRSKDFGLSLRRPVMFPLFGNGVFTQEGAPWKHSRELLRPQFARQQYKALNIFKDHVDDLLSHIPDNGDVFDLQPLLFRYALHTTVEFLFGISAKTLKEIDPAESTRFADQFDLAQSIIAARFRLLDFYWLAGGSKFRQSCASVHQFVDELIDRRLLDIQKEEKSGRYIFFDAIAKEFKDKRTLRDHFVTLLLPGRDASGSTLSWAFHLISQHEDVLACLLDEIDSTVGRTADPTWEDLKKMPYLANVLKETLRLFPALAINGRSADRDTLLPTGGGPDRSSPIMVRKGESVVYLAYSMHRSEALYGKDPEEFRPDRWNDRSMPLYEDELTASWGYLPFSGGPRTCLGKEFALAQLSYTIVRILQKFPTLRPAPGQKSLQRKWLGYSSYHKTPTEQVSGARQMLTLVVSPADGLPMVIGK